MQIIFKQEKSNNYVFYVHYGWITFMIYKSAINPIQTSTWIFSNSSFHATNAEFFNNASKVKASGVSNDPYSEVNGFFLNLHQNIMDHVYAT